jgi:parvulin-like peptidyl-prolyl isomerase
MSRVVSAWIGRLFGVPLLSVGLVLVVGCHRAVTDPQDPRFVVAESDQWQITRAQLDEETDMFLKQYGQTRSQVASDRLSQLQPIVLDNLIMRKLLLAQAATLPLGDLRESEAQTLQRLENRFVDHQVFLQRLQQSGITLDELKRRIHTEELVRRTLEMELPAPPMPSAQEIAEYYQQHPDLFTNPSEVRVSRILVLDDGQSAEISAKKLQTSEAARNRVKRGEDFAKVASEVSQDRFSNGRGGDIGFFSKGTHEKAFDDIAFTTPVGSVSPVFRTLIGYCFLKVTAMQASSLKPLPIVQGQIATYLRKQGRAREADRYHDELFRRNGVITHVGVKIGVFGS